MLEHTHTSLELNKWLKEKGFDVHSNTYITDIIQEGSYYARNRTHNKHDTGRSFRGNNEFYVDYNSYDILNDLCNTYAKELFGEEEICTWCGKLHDWEMEEDERISNNKCNCDAYSDGYRGKAFEEFSRRTFELVRQGKKEEAEQYIMDNCIL